MLAGQTSPGYPEFPAPSLEGDHGGGAVGDRAVPVGDRTGVGRRVLFFILIRQVDTSGLQNRHYRFKPCTN